MNSFNWFRQKVQFQNLHKSKYTQSNLISIVQAIFKGANSKLKNPIQLSFFHIPNFGFSDSFQKGDSFLVEFIFVKSSPLEIESFIASLVQYLNHSDAPQNFYVQKIFPIENRNLESLQKENTNSISNGEICLDFITPIPFELEQNKNRVTISKEQFVHLFEQRIQHLFGMSPKLLQKNPFQILPYYWNYTEIKRNSFSQKGETQFIKGCVGSLYLKGDLSDFLPYLLICSELHIGKKLSNSLGYYTIHWNSKPFFTKTFPDKSILYTVVEDVSEKYDNMLYLASEQEGKVFTMDSLVEEIHESIQLDKYSPRPSIGFELPKKDGTKRLIEKPKMIDLIVQKYIYKILVDYFDRFFEQASIGFRKGYSREIVIQKIDQALRDGFEYVLESDIENFFPSVDLEHLLWLIDFYIPDSDQTIKHLIYKIIKSGYLMGQTFMERKKGLSQGSPLSPLFANLYLDSFDEKLLYSNHRLIRYADDFLILTKTSEDAHSALHEIELFLESIGLNLKMNKTKIHKIEDGLEFLGLKIGTKEPSPLDIINKLKKPLYITIPYSFLALNGDAIDIKLQDKLIETVPLRRISDIIVTDQSVFSTSLIRKCTESNIPFTITLSSGYYVTTIRPDTKKYYEIVNLHTQKFQSISDTTHIAIASLFVVGKLKGSIQFFKDRYLKENHSLLLELKLSLDRIYNTMDLDTIRGIEGSLSKKVFSAYNQYISVEKFHIKKRERKKPDPINSLLNFGYYLLFSRINATLRSKGLNPYLGFLHSHKDNYESLVSDIVELFRSDVDRFIIALVNRKEIQIKDYTNTQRGWYLKYEKRRLFLEKFETMLNTKSFQTGFSVLEEILLQTNYLLNWVMDKGSLVVVR